MDIIFNRRTVREFKDELVTNEDIMKIIHAGMMAPSARNQRPWKFIIIDDRDTLDELSKAATGTRLLLKAHQAIALVVDFKDLLSPNYALEDMGACCQNMLLEAASLGVGACWMGGYPEIDRTKIMNRILNVTEEKNVFSLVAIGFPNVDKPFYCDESRIDDNLIFHNKM